MGTWNEKVINSIRTDIGFTFGVTGRFPVISKRIWSTLADAQAWIDDTSTNSTACEGLILTVIDDTPTNNGVYYISKIATAPVAGKGTEGDADYIAPTEGTPGVLVKLGSGNDISDALAALTISSGYSATTYAENFTTAQPTVQTVASGDTLELAINKVEQAVGGLVDEVIKNEEVTANAVIALSTAMGIDETGDEIQYVSNPNTHYINDATSIIDATEKLDEAINTIAGGNLALGLEQINENDGGIQLSQDETSKNYNAKLYWGSFA